MVEIRIRDVIGWSYMYSNQEDEGELICPECAKLVHTSKHLTPLTDGNFMKDEMDSTYILYTVKWILAELVRLNSNLAIEDTQKIIDNLIERRIELIWKDDKGIKRILDQRLTAREQVIILLLDQSPMSVDGLQSTIEYRNKTNFIKILKGLHSNRQIELRRGECFLSPKGMNEAEKILEKRGYIA